MNTDYTADEPTLTDVNVYEGPTLIEFGTAWCGFCRAAQPLLAAVLVDYPQLRHLKIEDGPGRPLGRAFQVKLWPTLIFMRDGRALGRVVRPHNVTEIIDGLKAITPLPDDPLLTKSGYSSSADLKG